MNKNPASAGSNPMVDDPTRFLVPSPAGYLFPGGQGGVHAPGPLGQIEQSNDPQQAWYPKIPPALEFSFFQLGASGAGQQSTLPVSRPTLCRIIPAVSFQNAAAERWEINYAPEVASALGATFPGFNAARDVFLLPSAGRWIISARARDAAGANVVDQATLVLIDATNPDTLRTLYPSIGCQLATIAADTVLAAATDALVLTLAEVAALTSLTVVNTGAGTVRLSWGAAAAAATGLLLTASGTDGDRITFPSGQIPLESLHARSTAGSTIALARYS